MLCVFVFLYLISIYCIKSLCSNLWGRAYFFKIGIVISADSFGFEKKIFRKFNKTFGGPIFCSNYKSLKTKMLPGESFYEKVFSGIIYFILGIYISFYTSKMIIPTSQKG